ncbi:MAG: hypothetical protein EBT27_01295 [Betaproteobacteria bacterium]|nr:hypothetical protein [Betaproteobacteria bacterium]
MNLYFYRVFIPIQILTLLSFVLIFYGYIKIDWIAIFLVWFLIGPIGMGVGFHKLLIHRQFVTYKPIEYLLALLGTLSAYASIAFSIGNHLFHHKYADTDKDPSTPKKGFWESFLLWRMRNEALKNINVFNYCFREFLKDPVLKFLSAKFELIIWSYIIFLSLFGLDAVVNFFIIPSFIEHMRLNAVSAFSHINIPFSYKNFETKDSGYNNYIFGILSMGFGWHNNHHYDEMAISNKIKWWEIDVEGFIARCLSKKI